MKAKNKEVLDAKIKKQADRMNLLLFEMVEPHCR